jgi:[CysO sulfur-carrier protein]-S-L-cysteine hydrolase
MPPLSIPQAVLDAMIAQAEAERPCECCGFLVGKDRIERAVPLRNALASPVAYEVDARELLKVQRELRAEGREVMAVYHSHPTSAPVPSASDLARNGYGETIPHIIVGMMNSKAEVRAWLLGETDFREVEIDVSNTR